MKPYLIFQLNIWKERSYNRCNFYILTYTYLLFSNEVRPALVTPFSLSLVSHIGICSVSFDFQTKKKNGEYKSEKNVREMRTLLFKRTYTQNVKKERNCLLSLKKRGKKEICSLFSFFESLWVMIKFFFYFCISTVLFFLT